MITIGQLKKMFVEENIPDDTVIVTSGSDHSYQHVQASIEEAELDLKSRLMWEYYDKDSKNKKSNKVISVLVIQMY